MMSIMYFKISKQKNESNMARMLAMIHLKDTEGIIFSTSLRVWRILRKKRVIFFLHFRNFKTQNVSFSCSLKMKYIWLKCQISLASVPYTIDEATLKENRDDWSNSGNWVIAMLLIFTSVSKATSLPVWAFSQSSREIVFPATASENTF